MVTAMGYPPDAPYSVLKQHETGRESVTDRPDSTRPRRGPRASGTSPGEL